MRSWILLAFAPVLLDGSAAVRDACPPGSEADRARAATILARVPVSAEGSAESICFVASQEAGITPDGDILLPRDLPEIEAAARVAHLARHRHSRSALVAPSHDACEHWLADALDEEARAYAVELAVLDAAGEGARLPFAAEAAATREEERPRVIARWLRDHPQGAEGVPPLAASYANRCARGEER